MKLRKHNKHKGRVRIYDPDLDATLVASTDSDGNLSPSAASFLDRANRNLRQPEPSGKQK